MPKVSICIPTYKQVDYLSKTLDSVLAQDFIDYEIVITDDTPDNIVKNLIDTYNFGNRLRYFKNEIRLGSPKNWNKAVEYAQGEYIKILHHDDYFTFSDSLRSFVNLLEQDNNVDFAFSGAYALNISENREWLHRANENQLNLLRQDSRILFLGNFIGPPSSTIYKNQKISYDSNLKWVVDLDFYIQVLLKNKKFSFSELPLITSVSGALHNVTNDCNNNRELEIFEYIYLAKKIFKKRIFIEPKYFKFFENLFTKYKISSLKEIIALNIFDKIPFFIKMVFIKKKLKDVFKQK